MSSASPESPDPGGGGTAVTQSGSAGPHQDATLAALKGLSELKESSTQGRHSSAQLAGEEGTQELLLRVCLSSLAQLELRALLQNPAALQGSLLHILG